MDKSRMSMIVRKLGEVDYRMLEGSNDKVHLEEFLAYLKTLG